MTDQAALRSADPTTPPVDPQHPWPGLLAFQESDSAFFFGRDREAEELLALVVNHRVTVLFGLSGLGKSSLLGAGLFPRLRQRGFLPVLLRLDVQSSEEPSSQVIGALIEACRAANVDSQPPGAAESVWAYLHRADVEFWSPRNKPLTPVLVFDQFEELFSRVTRDAAGDERRARVVETIADLAEGRVPASVKRALDENPARGSTLTFDSHRYHLLIALREDYLPDLEELVAEMPSIRRSRLRLTHMRGDTAVQAVVAAGAAADIVTPEVATGIVRFVGESSTASGRRGDRPLSEMAIESALLCVVCRELNQQRIANHDARIDLRQLDAGGDILKRFYEDATRDAPPALQGALERRFITADGTREMVAYQALIAEGIADAAIEQLIARRLLRSEYREGRRLLELTHDRLTPVIREKRLGREQLEAEARARREQLAQIEAKSARVFRWLTAGLAGTVAILLAAILFGVNQYRRAQSERAIATEQANAATAASQRAAVAREEALRAANQATALSEQATKALAEAERERRNALKENERAVAQERIARDNEARAQAALKQYEDERRAKAALQGQSNDDAALVASLLTRLSEAPPPPSGDVPTSVQLVVQDVYGNALRGPLTIRVTRASDNRSFFSGTVTAGAAGVTLNALPAGGPYRVEISAQGYRSVNRFINVGRAAGSVPPIVLPIDPSAVRRVEFPAFASLPADLQRVLQNSNAAAGFEGQSGAQLYSSLSDLARAELLNVFAVAQVTSLGGADVVASHLLSIVRLRADRVRFVVDGQLRERVRDSVIDGRFREVAADLIAPPYGYLPAGSFKSRSESVAIQTTFFAIAEGPQRWVSEIGLDTQSGVGQAFQVARNQYPVDEHPYDVQQLLVQRMKVDTLYRPLP